MRALLVSFPASALGLRRLVTGVCLLTALSVWQPVHGQGYAPEAAVSHMTVAEGFEVSLVASEPLVRQPVCIEFDDRGRLWVIQYLQYPNPAGLTRVEVDRYSRTEYDRVPLPPPRGPRGADRITILSDTDGDGRMDAGADFVDGLNLASGLAFGHGGVYVLNVPYLLFYPDHNRDDVPDADPRVLLTGFGMQDAHSVANSLTWGPDGWLYGCQGSTVTANIRGHEFQQGVWRYRPETDEFELFCEGGGNSWGLDFDDRGNLFYSTNYGGHVLLHGVPGGYFVKSFAKHGGLHNPHAYGYFNHAPHDSFRGGHVTVGGLVYQGHAFPEEFRGKYIAGDLLGHAVYWHHIEPRGSTVATSHGGELLVANDEWFAPTDVTMGPDGAIYVADWHDARTAHPDPDADWDRTNGRIYRISAKKTTTAEPSKGGSTAPRTAPHKASLADPLTLTTAELLDALSHPNDWLVRGARQELVRRRDPTAVRRLQDFLTGHVTPQAAPQALWVLIGINALDEPFLSKLLDSPDPVVRYWTLRQIGEVGEVSAELAHRLDDFAEQEPDVWVRQQLACTAARLPAAQALPLINANIIRDIDHGDPYLPLLWWWAIERHSVSGREEVLRRFTRRSAWTSQLGRDTLLPRLVRRYTAEGTPEGFDSVVRLLTAAPDAAARATLWEPVLLGLLERDRPREPFAWQQHELARMALDAWSREPGNIMRQKLALAFEHRAPLESAVNELLAEETPANRQVALLEAVAMRPATALVPPLLAVLRSTDDDAVAIAALQTLSRIESDEMADALLEIHQMSGSTAIQSQVRDVLLGRRESARRWLEAVDRGEIAAAVTPLEQIRRVALLDDPLLDELVRRHWGRLDGLPREERLAEVRRLNNDLRAGTGDAVAGREVFSRRCASCHLLFGQGQKVGPDLTTANRTDREALLISLVDPSSVIRKEYVSLVLQTTDGRIVTGLPLGETPAGITLVDSKGVPQTIAAGEIEATAHSTVSLMPDDLYRQLTPQELRDLFAYLQLPTPPQSAPPDAAPDAVPRRD